MLIKESHKRIEENLSNHSPNYIKNKQKYPAIGSVKVGRLNFDSTQAFFGQNDIPEKNKSLKKYIKEFKDPDIIQLKKKRWNMSVESPTRFDKFKDSQKDILFKIKHGFFDHRFQVQQKQKKIEAGVDTRNSYQGWNVSTQLTTKQKRQSLHSLTISSLQNTIQFNKSILKNYSKPIERYQKKRLQQNQRSIHDSDLTNTLKKQFLLFNPKASPQKTNASVFKALQQTRRQKLKESLFLSQNQLQCSKKFKANLSHSQKANIICKYTHNGCWSTVPWAENGHAWSCCMNEEKESRGCVKRVIDMNHLNYCSFNNA